MAHVSGFITTPRAHLVSNSFHGASNPAETGRGGRGDLVRGGGGRPGRRGQVSARETAPGADTGAA